VLVEFRLPDVGEGLEEGEIVSWLVGPGDTVARDQPLVEVQTDKALVELPSPVAGQIVSLAFSPGERVKVGQVLIVLEDGVGDTTVAATRQPTAAPQPAADAASPAGRPKAAPAVRKRALELGVDLATVTGTGPGGRILATDVDQAAAPGPASTPAPAAASSGKAPALGQAEPGRHPLRGIRRVTAEVMTRSWSEIPHITNMDEVDATGLLAARRRLAEATGGEVTVAVLLVAAVARGLRRFPLVNASLEGEEVIVHPDRHVGLAVATANGLVVPVVRQADRRGVADLAAEVRRLTEAARDQRVALDDLRGGTFTITNYGSLGGRFATPLIRPPEVGIMGFGAIRPRPLVVDGEVVARPTLPWCLSTDHRLIDGDLAVAFAEYVTGLLADPLALLAELLVVP
jgi:pyruvate/2-oxoglutarate dehydrogenase complex dihydrolipoamide acyltransferase (E2) component